MQNDKPPIRSMNKKVVVATCMLAGASLFVWGFLSHRQQFFPYGLIRASALRWGFVEHEVTKRHSIQPRLSQKPELLGLPYAAASYDENQDAKGVIIHDPSKAFEGINLYDSRLRGEAYLLDMEGAVVHRWDYDLETTNHVHVEIFPETGDLLVLVQEVGVWKIDSSSNFIWSYRGRPHHDLSVTTEGDTYLLTRQSRLEPEIHNQVEILEDLVTVLDPDGNEKQRFSIYHWIKNSPYASLIPGVSHLDLASDSESSYQGALDILHTNSIEVFDGRLAGRSPLFEKGNILISMRHMNAVAIIDPVEEEVLWLWGPNNLSVQHHPTLLENGHLLIFDNGTESSRIVELDPLTCQIEWLYDPGERFFSRTRGGSQRLPNGNTLITESDSGYAFEINDSGESVWRFASPEIDSRGYRQAIWRITRFSRSQLSFLGSYGKIQEDFSNGSAAR